MNAMAGRQVRRLEGLRLHEEVGVSGNLRELAVTTNSVRFSVLAIDSQAWRVVDGARSP